MQSATAATAGLLADMTKALQKAGKKIPEYLQLVMAEYNPRHRETATFAMHCYWEGEQKLGRLDGVLATRIGMLGGLEVVELDFDSAVLSYRSLVENARKFDCAQKVFARTDQQLAVAREIVGSAVERSDKPVDTSTVQQHDLANAPAYHYLPLTALQATKVNAAIATGEIPDRYLSPSQLILKRKVERVLAKDAARFAHLKPDRSREGMMVYAAQLKALLK